ncbi:hypothetical protein RJ640_009033 [Escallonia rubra]|uniref:K+ potassium transporter integral membrane domain-containing protein n=1 Tax=Escallonia rubra TaxID=112253 RepID=A0AA88UHK3_9ASTE|nr:hypothetical protein RJ640_009033 [Escallonia rubra]
MAEEGSERENGRLASMDSVESRWVFQDEYDSEIDNGEDDVDSPPGNGVDSEEDDGAEQRLIRTGPRIDSFDVEALEVPGVQRNDLEVQQQEDEVEEEEESLRSCTKNKPLTRDITVVRSIILACQTLGVVFGDVGTSPLYTFSVMFSKAPVNGKEDVLGALSLVLYTLILIPLIKHAKVSLLPNQLPSDAHISSFRLKVPSPELERSLKIKERLEASLTLKRLLLMLVLAGTSMVIADGVVTPAMSVMSAVGGLKVGVPGVKQDHHYSRFFPDRTKKTPRRAALICCMAFQGKSSSKYFCEKALRKRKPPPAARPFMCNVMLANLVINVASNFNHEIEETKQCNRMRSSRNDFRRISCGLVQCTEALLNLE